MTDYKFTQDWFSHNIPVWEQLKSLLPERKSFLEIGSFEGRSAVWIVENMMNPGDWIDCVDTWEGSEEHKNGELSGAEDRFDHNIIAALTAIRRFTVAAKIAGGTHGSQVTGRTGPTTASTSTRLRPPSFWGASWHTGSRVRTSITSSTSTAAMLPRMC